jgi:hypothetical protein
VGIAAAELQAVQAWRYAGDAFERSRVFKIEIATRARA